MTSLGGRAFNLCWAFIVWQALKQSGLGVCVPQRCAKACAPLQQTHRAVPAEHWRVSCQRRQMRVFEPLADYPCFCFEAASGRSGLPPVPHSGKKRRGARCALVGRHVELGQPLSHNVPEPTHSRFARTLTCLNCTYHLHL